MAALTSSEAMNSYSGPESPSSQGLGGDNNLSTIGAIGTGAVSGAATGSQVAPGWGTAIGAVVGALLSWYGMEKQSQAAKAANAQNLSIYNAEKTEEQKRYNKSLAMKQEEIAYGKAQTAREWKWKEEERNWNIVQGLSDRLLNIMNSQPSFQNLLLQRFPQQRQAPYNFRGLNPIGA
jgi:hypothetical protein